jgi:DNA-binding Lrp family transcriptional regulator
MVNLAETENLIEVDKKSKDIMQQTRLDDIDLRIIRLLAKDSRAPYKDIASAVGTSSNAAKERINKMVSNGVIERFAVRINPVVFGYERECILTLRNIDKTIKEQDILNKISLVGNIIVYIKHLEGTVGFVLYVRAGAEDKITTLADLLKPASVESIFVSYRPTTMRIHTSDFRIIKCLLSDARISINDIAKEASLSSKTAKTRLEKMRESRVIECSILTNLSAIQQTGYIEFAVSINVDTYHYQRIVERIYKEMEEYLFYIPNSYQKEFIFAVFFCTNISTVNSILRTLESYDGVNEVRDFIGTGRVYYQDWINKEIDKKIASQKYLSSLTQQ